MGKESLFVVEDLLIGNLKIVQDVSLYRFTSDSVLLSKFVKGKKREKVADFCSGSGIVGIHFLALNPETESVTLFEMQEELHLTALKTIELNHFSNVFAKNMKIQEIPAEYDEQFSLVLCNPPYEKNTGGFAVSDEKKAICRKEICVTAQEIISVAKRKLKFGGRLAMVNRADRVAEVLSCMRENNIEPKRLQFVSGKANEKPYLFLVEGVKGGKEGVEVLPTFVNKREENK